MLSVGPYFFKLAETAEEFAQVHRLNYQTFVQEIPQHPDSGTGLLVDKFHRKNRYIIGLRSGRVVAMLSYHDTPPFSVADRLADPSVLSQPGIRPLEVRLLAIVPGERHSVLLGGLIWCLHRLACDSGHTHFVISGIVEQEGLYRHMGFEPLGPAVGEGRARFMPMWATVAGAEKALERAKELWERRLERQSFQARRSLAEETLTP